MKRIAAFLLLALSQLTEAAPYDTAVQGRQATGTSFKTHIVAAPVADAVLTFNNTTKLYEWTFLSALVGGDVSADPIWNAAGDLVAGTGANTAAVLPMGTANQFLRVNGAGTGLVWATFAAGIGDLLAANNLSDLLNAATARTNLGLAIGTNVQAYDADLSTYAGITPLANTQTLLAGANYAAWRTSLGLVIGTNVQAWNAKLDTYAALADGTAGFQLTTNGAGGLSWAAAGSGGGSGAFSDAGDPVLLNTTTKDVAVGAARINSSKFSVDGDADQIQLSIQGHTGQTANLLEFRDVSNTLLAYIDEFGQMEGPAYFASLGGVTTTYAPDGTIQYNSGVNTGLLDFNGITGNRVWTFPDLTGNVVLGPATTVTDNALARYDGTTGEMLQDSSVIVTDTGSISSTMTSSGDGLTISSQLVDSFTASGKIWSGVFRTGGVLYPGIWMGNITPSISNYAFLNDGNNTFVNGPTTEVAFRITNANKVRIVNVSSLASVGIGTHAPSAALDLRAGSATANTAPLKLRTGPLLTTPEAGAIEYLSGVLYHTNETPTRSALLRADSALDGELLINDTVDDDSLDFGTGGDQIGAQDLPFTDIGNIITATEVESALQEIAERSLNEGVLMVTVDGSGSTLTTGSKGFVGVPYDCTIIAWRVIANAAGNIEFDVEKAAANTIPSASIVSTFPPILTADQIEYSTTLTGWTTSCAKGEIVEFEITGTPATITRATLEIITVPQ